MQKNIVCHLQGQGDNEGHMGKKPQTFSYVFWGSDSFATKLGLVVH